MKIALRILIITLFVAVITFGVYYYFRVNISQQTVDKYNVLIKQGDDAFAINEYADALTNYSNAADLIPTKVDSYSHILDVLILKNQLGMSEDIVNKSSAAVSNSDKYVLELKLAQAFLKIQDYDKAKTYFTNANNIKTTDETRLGLGTIDIYNNNLDDASKLLSVINDSNYNNFAQAKLLLAYLKLSSITDAKSVLSAIDTTQVKDTALQAKIVAYNLLLTKGTTDDLYNSTLVSKEFVNQGFPNLTVKVLEPQLPKMGEYFDGLYFLSRAYYDLGKYQSSMDVAQTAASISNDYRAYLIIARDYYLTQDFDNSFSYYNKAIVAAPDANEPIIYQEYIKLLSINNRQSEIETQLNAAYKKFNTSWVELLYTDLYYNEKNYTKMATYIDKLGKRSDLTDADKKSYFKYKILYSIENGKLTQANEDLNLLKSLDRYNPEYYWLNGWVLLIQNNKTEAKSNLNKAINYDLNGQTTENAKKLLARID